jgi:hypothetical protein
VLSERLPCLLEWRPDLERAVSALAKDRLLESSVEVNEPPAGRHGYRIRLPRCVFLVSSINTLPLCVDAIYEDLLARVPSVEVDHINL